MAKVVRLTDKQEFFCKEYLVDLNATQAAIRAGYSAKTAEWQGPQLLGKSHVKQRIQELMDARSDRLEITADKVLRELAKVAFADMKRYTSWGPDGVVLKQSSDLDDEDSAAVAEVSQTIGPVGGGSIKFKLHDKKGALDSLGKHLKLFTDKTEVTGADGAPLSLTVVFGD